MMVVNHWCSLLNDDLLWLLGRGRRLCLLLNVLNFDLRRNLGSCFLELKRLQLSLLLSNITHQLVSHLLYSLFLLLDEIFDLFSFPVLIRGAQILLFLQFFDCTLLNLLKSAFLRLD